MRTSIKKKSQKLQTIAIKEKNYFIIDKYLYHPDDVIGEGAFGKVYRGLSMRGQGKDLECAIKKMELPENMALMSDREKQTLDAIRKEILALKMLKHPNIVRLHDVKRMNNVIFMVMELCNESSLSEYLKQHKDITEIEIRSMFGEILNGFKYLRQKQIIHRDVKPENILRRNSVLKIADFGFAKQHDSKAILHSYLGTRATIAPQVIMGQYTHKCDIWSLGASLYYMCFKKYPFKDFYASEIKLMELMKRDCIEFPKTGLAISQPLKQVIIQMLRFNEEDRISWEELFACPLFQHKLLKEVGLNVFEYEEDQDDKDQENTIMEVSNIENFDFTLNDKSDKEIEQIEQNAGKLIDEAEIQRKNGEILSKLIKRMTFEKGKCNFLRLLSDRVHQFELTLSNRVIFEKSKVEISDHLKALRYGLNKYELIIYRGLLEWLKINKSQDYYQCQNIVNPLGVDEPAWEQFLEGTEKDKVGKVLDKEMIIFQSYVYQTSKQALIQVQSMNVAAFDRMGVNSEYFKDNFQFNMKFFITLFDLSMGLAKLLFPEIVKIRNNLDQLHKILPTLTLIDDLFILMNLDSVFVYSEETPVNFNAIFQQRKTNFSEDQLMYKTMYQRVLRAYEVFFE